MAGYMIFSSLAKALSAGFHVWDVTEDHYVVRTKTARGFALALARKGK